MNISGVLRMGWIIRLAIAFAVSATLSPAASNAQSAKLETPEITVGILPIAAHTPVFAAQELGYFAEEGLKVTTQFSVGGAALLPLVIQGQMQIGNIPISTGLQARAQNLDIVMIGPGTYVEKRQPPAQTATIVKANGPIANLGDLAGKKIAVNVINSVNWLYNREMLAKAGVDVKTVTYIELPFPNMMDAVVNGQVDAAATVQPFLFFGTSSGKVKAIGYDLLDVQPGAQASGFAVSRKWALANPHTLAAFERSVARAVDYLQQSEAQAVPLVIKFTRSKPEVVAGTGVPSWSNELSPGMIDVQMRLMVKHGLLQKPLDVRDIIWSSDRPQK
jgi:NitT/TauT family transport system substrate-binding protein